MPIYEYICPQGHEHEELMSGYNPPDSPACPQCGAYCRRNRSAEYVHTDCMDHPRWSEAMGVNPDQIPEAMRRFPGSTYDSEGRLLVKNRADKKKKMKERGYIEFD